MSSFAQQLLEASYALPTADTARVTPADGAAPFEVRVFQLQGDSPLELSGFDASPPIGQRSLEVLKSAWARPDVGDTVEILTGPGGAMTDKMMVTQQPLSTDGKRLVWAVTCLEEDLPE